MPWFVRGGCEMLTSFVARSVAVVSALAMALTTGTMHFGPYPSTTGDSGTCGPDWATDTVNRFFMIRQVAPMTFSVVQKFKGGTFITPGSPPFGPDPSMRSPGACDSSDGTPPGT